MQWNRVIFLAVTIVVSVFLIGQEQPESHRQIASPKQSFSRKPASVKSDEPSSRLRQSLYHELEKSGLASEKVQAILDLDAFHQSRPAFTQENIQRREELLELLLKDRAETVRRFSELMRSSKDDGLKSFLLNLSMNSKLDDDEKAEIILARLRAPTHISDAGVVPDSELSFMIGVSHLARLGDEELRAQSIAHLTEDQNLRASAGLRQILKDYELVK